MLRCTYTALGCSSMAGIGAAAADGGGSSLFYQQCCSGFSRIAVVVKNYKRVYFVYVVADR